METAPYTLAKATPLIIEPAGDKELNVVAMLVWEDGIHFGRTAATRAGFDLTGTTNGGGHYNGLVYWTEGHLDAQRCAIVRDDAGKATLGAPVSYAGAWQDVIAGIQIFDGPIAVAPRTTGQNPAGRRPRRP